MQIWGGFEKLAETSRRPGRGQENPKLLNGPKLEGDHGCISQREIDSMFASR